MEKNSAVEEQGYGEYFCYGVHDSPGVRSAWFVGSTVMLLIVRFMSISNM